MLSIAHAFRLVHLYIQLYIYVYEYVCVCPFIDLSSNTPSEEITIFPLVAGNIGRCATNAKNYLRFEWRWRRSIFRKGFIGYTNDFMLLCSVYCVHMAPALAHKFRVFIVIVVSWWPSRSVHFALVSIRSMRQIIIDQRHRWAFPSNGILNCNSSICHHDHA